MGASPGQFLSLNGRSTAAAGFTSTPVDPGLAAVVAIHPLQIPEITEGGSAGSDADGQHIHQGIAQPLQLFELQLPCGREGGDA